MSGKVQSFLRAGLLIGGVIMGSAARGQDPPLDEQLKQQIKLTKIDVRSLIVVQSGTVLEIKKEGLFGVPYPLLVTPNSTYREGALKRPGAFFTNGSNGRWLTVGEKIYVTKIDVKAKEDKVILHVAECDACNGLQTPSTLKAQVTFVFPKDYLSKADPTQITDLINEVLGPENTDGGQQAEANAPNGPADGGAAPADSAQPATVTLGQTPEQVKAILGQPVKVMDLTASPARKLIYIYKDVKITFVDGKVADVQ